MFCWVTPVTNKCCIPQTEFFCNDSWLVWGFVVGFVWFCCGWFCLVGWLVVVVLVLGCFFVVILRGFVLGWFFCLFWFLFCCVFVWLFFWGFFVINVQENEKEAYFFSLKMNDMGFFSDLKCFFTYISFLMQNSPFKVGIRIWLTSAMVRELTSIRIHSRCKRPSCKYINQTHGMKYILGDKF